MYKRQTTTWISAPVAAKKTDVLRSVATVPGLRPDRYLIANNHEVAGLALTWARDTVLGGTYDELTALAATSPAGSNGVLFTPWLAGLRSPVDDRFARGGWHNLALHTTRADLTRAVLEGVAFNTRRLLAAVEKFVGEPLDPLRVIGGGAQSVSYTHLDVYKRQPYQDRFPVLRGLPEQGRPRDEIRAELATMATEEDRAWESGQCSGTMYCGDHEHYDFPTEAFGRFAHQNACLLYTSRCV